MRLSGESKEVKEEVVRLAKLHGIITPFTSYLIIEEDRVALRPLHDNSPLARGRSSFGRAAGEALGDLARPSAEAKGAVPTDKSRRAGAGGAPGGRIARARRAFDEDSGADAVGLSKEIGALKKAEVAEVAEAEEFLRDEVNRAEVRIKKIRSRTFYLQGKRWIDAALVSGQKVSRGDGTPDPAAGRKVERVKYLSDEYFALLKTYAGIGQLLSVGSEVTFLWEGRIISVDS